MARPVPALPTRLPASARRRSTRSLNIARNLYGYEPGGFPSSLANEDEKYTVKLDWNINDFHRAALTYNYNDGFNNTESDDDAMSWSSPTTSTSVVPSSRPLPRPCSRTGPIASAPKCGVSYSELDARVQSLGQPDLR